MDKRMIIHQKFDMDKIKFEQVSKLHDMLKSAMPEEYIIITTPTDITKVEGNDIIITIDDKEYTTNELLDIIEKSWMYDELNK